MAPAGRIGLKEEVHAPLGQILHIGEIVFYSTKFEKEKNLMGALTF